jgi:hypothetical protein
MYAAAESKELGRRGKPGHTASVMLRTTGLDGGHPHRVGLR